VFVTPDTVLRRQRHRFRKHWDKLSGRTWRTFLTNHIRDLVSVDFFTVPTARLRVLFVLVVLAHHRRRVRHFNVTEHPTAAWTAQQIVDTFPHDTAPSISSAIATPSTGIPSANA
jgi:putative transposase